MRLFLTSYNKTGTHQIMPALRINEDVVDRSNNSMSALPDYIKNSHRLNSEGIEATCKALANFNSSAFGHMSYLPEYAEAIQKTPTKVIFNVRDPRDVIVAEYYNMMKHADELSWLNFWLEEKKCYVSQDDPISHLIDFAVRWERWVGWADHDFVYKVKYEDLRLNGLDTCADMAFWLKPYEINSLDVFNGLTPRKKNPTFRKGSVGDWKTEFSDTHKKKAEKVLGHIIERLGYEN